MDPLLTGRRLSKTKTKTKARGRVIDAAADDDDDDGDEDEIVSTVIAQCRSRDGRSPTAIGSPKQPLKEAVACLSPCPTFRFGNYNKHQHNNKKSDKSKEIYC